ncbi:hypothetical protein DFH06DRAFT_1192297 [Mycena polygramma]|nr:hypothetical protein DFH06DRAFT_1192297 [Mycena polygramma]
MCASCLFLPFFLSASLYPESYPSQKGLPQGRKTRLNSRFLPKTQPAFCHRQLRFFSNQFDQYFESTRSRDLYCPHWPCRPSVPISTALHNCCQDKTQDNLLAQLGPLSERAKL